MELKEETCSISKRQKSHGKGKHGVSTGAVVGGEDRIERLPDEMLCHILSFLETKFAVRTSVLSKRWKYFWITVPCIKIHNRLLSSPEGNRCFMDFVDRVLRLNAESCLRKFSLMLTGDYDSLRVGGWISRAIERDIEEFVLNFREGHWMVLPPSIFTIKKLVVLKLGQRMRLNVPASVYLPNLKIIHLSSVKFSDDGSVKNLIDGCPVLEELDMDSVDNYNQKTLVVRSSSLKSLRVKTMYVRNKYGDLKIVVDATNLQRLDLTHYTDAQYDINSLSSIVKVNLHLETNVYSNSLVELLRKLTTTQYLLISCVAMESFEFTRLDDLPIFHNLTHLVLNIFDYSWPALPCLLECSPNLVTFVCHREHSREQHLQFKAPKCSMLYLEEIELTGIKGLAHEMDMVRYFLMNFMVLKKLSIKSHYSSSKKQLEISKNLLTIPRGSPECQILFV